jgi:predicted TPR repeat methyltransferase
MRSFGVVWFEFRVSFCRYTHSETHIRDVAGLAGLRVATLTEGFLRSEYGTPVMGRVTVLRKDQA